MSAGTPRVSIRVPPDLWAAAQAKAATEATSVSAEVVRFLRAWTVFAYSCCVHCGICGVLHPDPCELNRCQGANAISHDADD